MNKPILALKLMVLAWLCVANVQATIRYVKPGSASTAWQSQTNVYNDLTSALTAAVYGDEIWMAAGTYKPTTGTDRAVSFNLKNGVAVYGGFAGTETQLAQRNWVNNPTILSGDIGVQGTDTDNSYNVVKAVGTSAAPLDNTTRLDGVIVEKGYANHSSGAAQAWGGGAYLSHANPIIANSIFRNNYASWYAGAVFAGKSSAVFANTIFLGNRANGLGGAVLAEDALTFTHCTFANNRSDASGGAVYSDNSSTTITNSIAWGNSAPQINKATCTYSCIEGGYTGVGNISSDPLFVDAANGDCHLNATSLCIDKGLNSATPAWLTTDFYGKARLASTTVDMGIAEGAVATPLVKTPANKTVFPGTVTSVALEWEWPSAQPTGISGYEIELQLNSGASQLITATNLTYTHSGITPGSAYKWRVRGIDGTTSKNWSPWATFTVKHATPLYVKTGGSGNGLSWATAMGSLQTAIDKAVNGDEIWVAAGTYKPTTGTDRSISFNLKNGVAIYGGFAGTETQLAQRNWVVNPTILSGDRGIPGTDTDNSYNVVKAVGKASDPLDNTTRLDGVVIEKGYADHSSGSAQACGGGAYLSYASLTISNVVFRNNYALYDGGAVYANNGNPLFANTLFWANNAKFNGGAVYTESASTFTHCTFANNRSENVGGAIYSSNSSTTITNSIAWENSAKVNYPHFTATSTYSCVVGEPYGTGNIGNDPLFVDPANGDFRLRNTSPCIDKGLNSATPTWLTSDYYGNARLAGTNVDMGITEGGIVSAITITPTEKTVYPSTTTKVELQWGWQTSKPSNITGYEIELKLNDEQSVLMPMSGTQITISNTKPLSAYKWRVRGIDGTALKNWSPWATFYIKRTTPLYVKPGGTGDGLSWGTAMGSLQTALEAAVYCDEIWVAAGTYKPTTTSDRTISFNLKNGVAVYGGFAGTETTLSQRNWVNNPTILSGDIGVAGTDTDNSYSVIKAVGTLSSPIDHTTRIDGVVIEKGYANTSNNTTGGGAYLSYGSPTIANTLFRNNFASNGGGAMYAANSNSLIANTLFLSNKSNNIGGAVYSSSALTFTHCIFANNRSETSGGALYNINNSISIITNSIAWGNSAKNGNPQLGNATCTYSCIEGGYTGIGNTASDPLLIDAANGDCRLNTTSPCIDKGLNSATPAWLTTDFYGNARLAGTSVDMGAIEGGVATPHLKTPTNEAVLPGTTTSVALEWEWLTTQPSGITGYEIELQLNGAASQLLSSTNMTYTLNGIVPASVNKWRVRGIDGTGLKNWSPWATFIVKHATPLYVKPGGTGDGLSWATAMGSVQTAIDAALYGDEIWVAAGTYKPTTSTDRTISFNLKNGVAIYGGFTATETILSQRNWINNPTILSGDIGVEGTDTDNSYNVIIAIGKAFATLDNTTRIDGLIIEKGYANTYANSTGYSGAGANLSYASPIIANTLFRNNFAISSGGAINAANSNSIVTNTLFLSNKSNNNGGAVNTLSELVFTHCTFANNRSEKFGGAVYSNSSSTTITNSIAWGNSCATRVYEQFSYITCTYSCVEGGYTGNGNISSDPLFVDAANGDCRLNATSPCIDKGLNSATPAWLTADFYGKARLAGNTVDMGIAEGGVSTPLTKTPTNKTALPSTTTSVALEWEWPSTQPNGITGYEIELQLNDNTSKLVTTTTMAYTLSGITQASAYKWRVRSIDGTASKNWSPWATFTVKHDTPLYVKPGGTGNGLSWATAMGSLQAAIDEAIYGDEIWIAAGTYKPTTTTDRTISFNIKNGVAIYGGFAGNETMISQRNWVNNLTILSGDIGVTGNDTDNSNNVVKAFGQASAPLDNTTRIDGLIIEKGYANTYNNGKGDGGAGANLSYASPIIANTVFRNNIAAYPGGAVYAENSNSVVANTLFLSNKSNSYGGAVYTLSALTFTHCTFTNNRSEIDGGALYSTQATSIFTNSIAWGNSAKNSIFFNNANVNHSCVEAGSSNTGIGNTSSDPLFVDAANGDYRLQNNSPCINKGLNSATPAWLTTDFYGNARLVGAAVDMGIAESSVITSNKPAIPSNARSVSVYPNPVKSNQPVEIKLTTIASNAKVRLFDASGTLKVEEAIVGTDQYTFDKTNFAPGVYILEIVEAGEKSVIKLIIH
jgi:predicted outer membrane repeat protein